MYSSHLAHDSFTLCYIDHSTTNPLRIAHAPMALHTAADLPSETVHAILAYALGPEPSSLLWNEHRRCELKAFSLTCRYWAQLCRPHIFYVVTLRDLKSLESLAVLLRSPSTVAPRLADCVHDLRVIQSGALCTPWLHRVDTILRSSLPRIERSTLTLSNIDNDHRTLPSRLPRTMPISFFSFKALYLDTVRFSNASDFVRLLAAIPSVETVHCKRISLDEQPSLAEQEVVLSIPQKHSLRGIFVNGADNITGDALCRILFACLRLRANRLFYMPPRIWNAMSAAVTTLCPSISKDTMELALRS